jgi:DNA topoisomerase I
VCSKYYVHPQIVQFFRDGKFIDFLRAHDAPAPAPDGPLRPAERLVLRMLVE